MKTREIAPILLLLLLSACSTRPPHASAVSTAALSGHITLAQSKIAAAQAYSSADEGKAVIISQWLSNQK